MYVYIYIYDTHIYNAYVYIYIYIWHHDNIGWHYLSNATCLMQPHLFHACRIVSRITIICYIIHRFRRRPALDK